MIINAMDDEALLKCFCEKLVDSCESDENPKPIEVAALDQNSGILKYSAKYFMHYFLVLLVGICSFMMVLKRLESLRLFEDAGSQLEVPAVSSLVQPASPDKTNQHSWHCIG